MHMQSCLRAGYSSKRDSEMLKTQFIECRSVKQSRLYRDSIKYCNIDLRLYNVTYVEYRVVYTVVEPYILHVL